MTHNDPQEASPQYLNITTPSGVRKFRYGSRASNPVDQWPDPDVYVHAASGQRLSGSETRNINRAYPGRPDGNPPEQAAYAIAELIPGGGYQRDVRSSRGITGIPGYQRHRIPRKGMSHGGGRYDGADSGRNPDVTGAVSVNLHGLTHRELGDYTGYDSSC